MLIEHRLVELGRWGGGARGGERHGAELLVGKLGGRRLAKEKRSCAKCRGERRRGPKAHIFLPVVLHRTIRRHRSPDDPPADEFENSFQHWLKRRTHQRAANGGRGWRDRLE